MERNLDMNTAKSVLAVSILHQAPEKTEVGPVADWLVVTSMIRLTFITFLFRPMQLKKSVSFHPKTL